MAEAARTASLARKGSFKSKDSFNINSSRMGRRAEPRELNSIEDMIQALEPLTPDEAAQGVVLPEQLEAHAVEIRAPKPHVLPLIRAAEPSCPCPFFGTSFQKKLA